MSEPNAKRRCVTTTSPHPPSVPSATTRDNRESTDNNNKGLVSPTEPQLVRSKLEGIPRLLVEEIHKNNAKEVIDALKTLDDILSEGDETDIDAITDLGGPLSFVVVMRKWQATEDIQHLVCSIVFNLTLHGGPAAFAMIQSGGMEAAVNALKKFPESREVQSAGMWVLKNLLGISPIPENEALQVLIDNFSKRLVEEYDGIALVLHGMNAFLEDSEIVASCCWVLSEVYTKDRREKFVKSGVVNAVGAALQKYFHDYMVVEPAEQLMEAMFSS